MKGFSPLMKMKTMTNKIDTDAKKATKNSKYEVYPILGPLVKKDGWPS